MKKHGFGVFAFFLLASILPLRLIAAENWGEEHRDAHRMLLRIFEEHKNFRVSFSKWLEEHPRHAEAVVNYVLEDKEHSIEGFLKREARERHGELEADLAALRHLHENHTEAMKKFRNWIQDYPKAAAHLVKHPALVHAVEEEARERR